MEGGREVGLQELAEGVGETGAGGGGGGRGRGGGEGRLGRRVVLVVAFVSRRRRRRGREGEREGGREGDEACFPPYPDVGATRGRHAGKLENGHTSSSSSSSSSSSVF